jgi:hypothetical protein
MISTLMEAGGQLDTPAALAQGQGLDFQLKRGQDGPRNWSGGSGEDKNLWSHAGS